MRLGFYYHIPAIKKDGKILMPGYLGRFLDALADNCEELILFQHIPNSDENAHFDYTIQSSKIKLVSLPQRISVPYRVLHPEEFTGIIQENLSSLDALLIRGPTPLLPAIAKTVKRIPTIFLIVGDYLAGVNTLPQPWWRKELIRLWSWVNYKQQLHHAKHSLVFVNSRALYRQFKDKVTCLGETRTTTLSQVDFFKRENTCLSFPIRLLYAGRLDSAKGLLDMVQALGLLVAQGYDMVLDLVGWAEEGSDILLKINQEAICAGVKDRIKFHGYKAVGPELFDCYKNADIYLIASQSSFEGFPRTIWEAMAHSLPVVATRVGSIPDFVEGAAELAPPKDPAALAQGIKHLVEHTELRKGYIQKGFALASQNTLEAQVGEMGDVIHKWMEGQHE